MKFALFYIFFILLVFSSCTKNQATKKQDSAPINRHEAIFDEDEKYELYTVQMGELSESVLCRLSSTEQVQVPLENFCNFIGLQYEVCSRCGNVSVFLKNGDILLVEWNSPYVDFANKKGRVTLKSRSVYAKGKTFVGVDFFSLFKLFEYSIEENKILIKK